MYSKVTGGKCNKKNFIKEASKRKVGSTETMKK
jgi:hypothetical protein